MFLEPITNIRDKINIQRHFSRLEFSEKCLGSRIVDAKTFRSLNKKVSYFFDLCLINKNALEKEHLLAVFDFIVFILAF